ncbi:MAG: glycogen synthase GlgA [Oscillospiraceae bacterium]|nr:glycogen synthase GlgA [Oscillospiraceae bacterium]
MKILFCSSEVVPFAASGGLGDVAGSLPKSLNAEGQDVRVILPLYGKVKEKYSEDLKFIDSFNVSLGWRNQYCGLFTMEQNGVTYYLLDNEFYFNRPNLYGYGDDGERFAFYSKAILESLLHLDFEPDIIHANDWQSALVTLYINVYYRHIQKFQKIKTVFTIHNIAYQGQYGYDMIADTLGLPQEWAHHAEYNGDTNFMKAAIENADKVTTVSPTYAQEILDPWFAHGLDPILREKQHKLWGILNGIDYESYNPKTDKIIVKNFHADAFIKNKAVCKKELRSLFNLEEDGSPIISMVTRLVGHKGVDIIVQAMQGLIDKGYQVVVLGTGESQYEEFFRDLAARYPGRVGVEIAFIPALSRKIYAGSDMFLMPSKSEPCGLSQMIALRYGTIPVVRETGGLKDSVKDSQDGVGNGFTFANYSADELYGACMRAYEGYQDTKGWRVLVKRAMQSDCSWKNSAKEYIRMYEDTMKLW